MADIPIKITETLDPICICASINIFSTPTISHLKFNLKLQKPFFPTCDNERFLCSLVELANCDPSIHGLQQLFVVC